MLLTIPEQQLETNWVEQSVPKVAMGWGYELAEEDVIQVASLGPSEEVASAADINPAGDWTLNEPPASQNFYTARTDELSPIVPVISAQDTEQATKAIGDLCEAFPAVVVVDCSAVTGVDIAERADVYVDSSEGNSVSGELDIIRYQADAFNRIDGLIDTDYLVEKTVTVVGLGTGGSRCAVELAKAGVGEFNLVDFDRLETHNITRHECGLSDIGRLKIDAVKDAIKQKHPDTRVNTYPFDVVEQREQFREVVKASDILVVGTDSEMSKLVVNRLSLDEDVPAVYAGAYERGFGGDVIRVVPGETACYDCVLGQLQDELDYSSTDPDIDYSEAEDPTEVSAEPGLSTDVGFLSLIQTKFALATLLRDTDSEFETYDENMLFWGTKPEWIFSSPFQSQFAETTTREDCETCQRETFYEAQLGMSPEEVKAEAEQIVEETDTLDDDLF